LQPAPGLNSMNSKWFLLAAWCSWWKKCFEKH